MFKEALSEDNVTEMDAEIIQAEETEIDAVIELDERVEASSQCRKYKLVFVFFSEINYFSFFQLNSQKVSYLSAPN